MSIDPSEVKSSQTFNINETFIVLKCFLHDTEFLTVKVYLGNDNFIEGLEKLTCFLKELLDRFEGVILVGKGFNACIGLSNQSTEELTHGTVPIIESAGKQLVEKFKNLGLFVLYGRSTSDRKGNITFHSADGTIDFVWSNYRGLSTLTDMSVINIGHSDYFLVLIITEIPLLHATDIINFPGIII